MCRKGRDHGGLERGRDGCRETDPLWSRLHRLWHKPERFRMRTGCYRTRERERERIRATSTQCMLLMYRKGKKKLRRRRYKHICIELHSICTRARYNPDFEPDQGRLGYNSSLLPSRRSGSSRTHRAEWGLAQETGQKPKPLLDIRAPNRTKP